MATSKSPSKPATNQSTNQPNQTQSQLQDKKMPATLHSVADLIDAAPNDCVQASSMKPMNAEGKLSYVTGMIQGTLGSVCDYSAAALKDRMRFMQAVLEGDESGREIYGLLCFQEQREQHPEIFCPE